jgi:hypothetical protein
MSRASRFRTKHATAQRVTLLLMPLPALRPREAAPKGEGGRGRSECGPQIRGSLMRSHARPPGRLSASRSESVVPVRAIPLPQVISVRKVLPNPPLC